MAPRTVVGFFVLLTPLLFEGPVSYGDGIHRVGSYREYSGYYGSGGGYLGSSADHWMFHQRQYSRGPSEVSPRARKEPVRPNMVLVPVQGVHLYTDTPTKLPMLNFMSTLVVVPAQGMNLRIETCARFQKKAEQMLSAPSVVAGDWPISPAGSPMI